MTAEDKLAVAETVYRYAVGIDTKDFDLYRSIFADDVMIDFSSYSGGAPARMTADQWVAGLKPLFFGLGATQHSFTNPLRRVDGDSATCRMYMQAHHVYEPDRPDSWFTIGGYYDDTLVRAAAGPAGWLLTGVTLTVLWRSGDPAIMGGGSGRRAEQSWGGFVTGVGLCVPQLGEHVTPEAFSGFCTEAERLGYTSLWVQDHFLWPLQPKRGYAGRPGLPIPEQYKSVMAPTELLAIAATLTSTPRLGTSILVQGNHWPASLAQRLATLDIFSGGRLLVGLGQGWNAEEHEASGTSVADRAARMDEFVAVLRACWGPDPVSFEGKFFSIPPAIQRPKPQQRPSPPLLSGAGSGPGLDRTARLFDGWNPAGIPVEQAVRLAAEMDAVRPAGRAPLSVYLRTFVQFLGPADPTDRIVDRLVKEVRDASKAGFAELIIEHNFWDEIKSPEDWLAVPEQFAPVVAAAREAS